MSDLKGNDCQVLEVSTSAAVNGQRSTVNGQRLLGNHRVESFKFHSPVAQNECIL